MSALVVYPPLRRSKPALDGKPTVFLAGSIEMGNARDWQSIAIEALSDHASVIYNPRRLDWNPEWEQSIEHVEFNNQVNWELDMIYRSDLVLLNLEPETKSPISLMELGNRTYHIHVVCPPGFWRKGNVDIFCERNRIPLSETLEEGLELFKATCALFTKQRT